MGILVSNQRTKRLEKLETLIWRADLDSPATLDDEDREAIHIVIRIALESDAVFRRALRRSGPLIPTKETDYVCDVTVLKSAPGALSTQAASCEPHDAVVVHPDRGRAFVAAGA